MPVIKQGKSFSSVWIVPLIAIVFGGYLMIKAYLEKGTVITIRMPESNGMIAGKTAVKYKGFSVGLVKSLTVTKDLNGVELAIEINPRASLYLNSQTQFWVVKPEISFGGVAGLETILSGNYIAMRPGKNKSLPLKKEYKMLSEAPPLASDTPGLHLSLITNKLGSVGIGSLIFHRNIAVGKVNSYNFLGTDKVEIKALIKPKFAELVNDNSHFWNVSGISLEGGVSGFELKLESVASLVAGGIAFDTPKYLDKVEGAVTTRKFELFQDYKAAKVAIKKKFILPFDARIKTRTKVIFKGHQVGFIRDYKIDPETFEITANVDFDPRAQFILNSKTQFFLVSPKVSLTGVSNLDTIFSGNYISFHPSLKGDPQDTFRVAANPPPKTFNYPGLHLKLLADDVSSVSHGSPVYYKDIPVGDVQQVKLQDDGNSYLVSIYIKKDYAYLVTNLSSFWNASGIKLKGSLLNFELQTASVATALSGGIQFDNIKNIVASDDSFTEISKAKNGDSFVLHRDQDATRYTKKFTLVFQLSDKIETDVTKLIFNQIEIGKVIKTEKHFNSKSLVATIAMRSEFAWLLNKESRFWLVDPAFTHSKMSELMKGQYINVSAGYSKLAKTRFKAELRALGESIRAPGLQLKLTSKGNASVKVGASVYHHGIAIGFIAASNFSQDKQGVELAITITKQNQHLVTSNSRFYLATGIDFKIDQLGANLRTESLSSIISGGLGLYNSDINGDKVAENTQFSLYPDYESAEHAGIAIKIEFASAVDLHQGMLIKYQGQEVGKVERIRFKDKLQGVVVDARLYQVAAHLASEDAQIWKVIPSIGLVGNKNLESLISSHLGISGGAGAKTTHFNAIDHQPATKKLNSGLNLILTARQLGSVRAGDPLLFRQATVGKVLGTEYDPAGQQNMIYINIQKRYQQLVTQSSVFWNASGIRVDAGLFSGIDIDTESIETIIAGGIAFANPTNSQESLENDRKLRFQLHQVADSDWLEW